MASVRLCSWGPWKRVAPIFASAPTGWGQHEGAHIDPDGNLIRFGSAMVEESDS